MKLLSKIRVKNYRCIGDLEFEPSGINVFFGPNGVGKTTFLDVLDLIKEMLHKSIQDALDEKNIKQGIVFDKIEYNDDVSPKIEFAFETEQINYELAFSTMNYRLEKKRNESIYNKSKDTSHYTYVNGEYNQPIILKNDVTKLFSNSQLYYLDLNRIINQYTVELPDEIVYLQIILSSINLFTATSFRTKWLMNNGSSLDHQLEMNKNGLNLLSLLRNLRDREVEDKRNHKNIDTRFKTIINYMRLAFTNFEDIRLEQMATNNVYSAFYLKDRKDKVYIHSVSYGMLQFLILITSLFYQEPDKPGILMYDEPETSLHPWAIAVFAKALKEASEKWNKQIFISTHSPVLISQFEDHELVECSLNENGSTQMKKLSDIEDVQDILEHYSAGTLYMTGDIGRQGAEIDEYRMLYQTNT